VLKRVWLPFPVSGCQHRFARGKIGLQCWMSLHSMPCALAPCLLPLLLPPKAQLAARMFACSLSLPNLPTCCRVSACIVLVSTVLLGSCTFLARHQVVRVFTEDIQIRAATAVVVPAVATSIVGKLHLLYQGLGPHHPLPSTWRAIGSVRHSHRGA
jgi:hypothetical protein